MLAPPRGQGKASGQAAVFRPARRTNGKTAPRPGWYQFARWAERCVPYPLVSRNGKGTADDDFLVSFGGNPQARTEKSTADDDFLVSFGGNSRTERGDPRV